MKKKFLLIQTLFLFLVFVILTIVTLQLHSFLKEQKEILGIECVLNPGIKKQQIDPILDKLKKIPGISKVDAVSPEDSVQKVLEDSTLGLDASWIQQKSNSNNGHSLFPWTLFVKLERWDPETIHRIEPQIEETLTGPNHESILSEKVLDSERVQVLRNGMKIQFGLIISWILSLFILVANSSETYRQWKQNV